MSNELAGLLGDKYTPSTHDYLLSNRRSSHAKKLEGWASVGELTNHGEVMVVLQRVKPVAPVVAKPAPTPSPTTPKPTLGQRIATAVKGK